MLLSPSLIPGRHGKALGILPAYAIAEELQTG